MSKGWPCCHGVLSESNQWVYIPEMLRIVALSDVAEGSQPKLDQASHFALSFLLCLTQGRFVYELGVDTLMLTR